MDEILKPNYNTVDLSEVELVDSETGPRDNDTTLMTVLYSNTLKVNPGIDFCFYKDATRDDRAAPGWDVDERQDSLRRHGNENPSFKSSFIS